MVRLFLVFSMVFFSVQTYAAECGLFKVTKGDVSYKKKSKKKFRKARVNKKVCSGYTIKTGKDSRAKIKMADGNEINLSPKSEMVIEQYERNLAKGEKKVLLNVIYGKIRSNVKDKYKDTKNNHYRVKTKSAVAGVRGTEFLASFNQNTNQSRIVTFEGVVAVGKFDGTKFVADVTVKPGQFTSNTKGTKPHAARQVPPKEFARLNRDTNIGPSAADQRDVANDAVKSPDKSKKDGAKKKAPESRSPDSVEPANGPSTDLNDGIGSDDKGANLNEPAPRGPDSADVLPPPEPPKFDAGGVTQAPNIREIRDFQPPVVDRPNVRDIIQNKKVKITIIPTVPGANQ